MQTARKMGIKTVVVYSDADRNALHVEMASQAVHIGASDAAVSYLNIENFVNAAVTTGADAIHPGYGFLLENPDFVDAVTSAGITFVGPFSDIMRAMGLKDAAKALMNAAGVPVVPGYEGADQSVTTLEKAADDIGYPVVIKAVAGGGGKGMRLVETTDQFQDALERAQNEAKSAFGNGHVLIEKYITTPRQIEVQIFGDGIDVVHRFERYCSCQRRHHKVIEEAPAPKMPDDVRAAMTQAAVLAAKATNYTSAGTVEFIVDGSGPLRADGFWFMEMNTCLPVEHPVTEAITGVDLVDWQLPVASGEPIPMAQDNITISGHALEARLYAEDRSAGFLPATGQLEHLNFIKDARIDTGVRAGDQITPYYDPMIAKITVHKVDRATALAALDHALATTQIAGTTTNLGFLKKLNLNADFQAAKLDAGLIDRHLTDLTTSKRPCTRAQSISAVAALGPKGGGFALWSPLRWRVQLMNGDRPLAAWISASNGWLVEIGDATHQIEHRNGAWRVDEQKTSAETYLSESNVTVFWNNAYLFDVVDPMAQGSADVADADRILSPMPGKVIALNITHADRVEKGQPIAVQEATKMEHTLTAPRDAVVAEVAVAQGDQIAAGALIVRFETDE